MRRLRQIAPLAAAACALLAPAAAAAPPDEGICPSIRGHPDTALAEDAMAPTLREGALLGYSEVLGLRELLPPEVWRHRDVFFFDGMRMQIGPCHRRYPEAPDHAEATRRFSGRARVDAEGNLRGYVAGTPFPPETIDPAAPDAALRWAWNLEQRYRGAGPFGRFRLEDIAARGDTHTYLGWSYFVRTRHRADLADTEYAIPEAGDSVWISGGRFDAPFDARHLAWRQERPLETQQRYAKSDEVMVYVPSMRKVRRAASGWVDGLFVPRYRVAGDGGGGSIPVGGSGLGPTGAVQPGAAESIQVTEHLRRGFTGLALRPNAYTWRWVEEREVLAPINTARSAWPQERDRNFGPSGLAIGSDRWEVRQAVVIEGAARVRGGEFDRLTLYVDHQTQQPLYTIARRHSGALVDVTIPVHRFSGDVTGYPPWPSGAPARVFDPVVQVSYSESEGGGGWRREAFGTRSVPMEPHELRRVLSSDYLARSH